MPRNCRVASIVKRTGFGASLIAKLKESSIRKNLYYEIKDRIVEETSDELGRPIRRKQRTKVYGLDSTKDTRDVLINILRERMERHKDKFNSPTIYDELSKMVVKRNGKVEHSDNSHDDLVFSYLMAMYVWYEGKYLKENFHIDKKTIRTEEDQIDEAVNGLEDKERKYTDIVEEMVIDDDKESVREEVKKQIKELKAGQGFLYNEWVKSEREKDRKALMALIKNPEARKAYSKFSGIPIENLDALVNTSSDFTISPEIFNAFNSGESIDKYYEKLNEKNMNFEKINPGR